MQRPIWILLAGLIILLALNLALIYGLNLARLAAIDALSNAETTLDKLANEVIVYNIKVNQAVPVKADVPLNQKIDIPLDTVIPIDQVIKFPFKTGNTQIELEMPIKADFPIDMVVPVQFNNTISVDTTVQLDTAVPVKIELNKTQLAGYIEQARLDVKQLKNRLMLSPAVDPVEISAPANQQVNIAEPASLPVDISSAGTAAAPAQTPTRQRAPTAQPPTPMPVKAAVQTNSTPPQMCEHAYWPLRAGSAWTYNSPHTSYTLQLANVAAPQILFSTEYEGRTIEFSLECRPEGLAGQYLGDMRRLTELGDLKFGKVKGLFLPRPEEMEHLGQSWRQEFEVSGTVPAVWDGQGVTGSIGRGQAVATYLPAGFEPVETPLGPQQGLRLEQNIELTLELTFNLGGESVPAVEVIKLTNVYWFVKGVGLVKTQWQGGGLALDFKPADPVVDHQLSVPALAEEQLVFICVSTAKQDSECIRVAGVNETDLQAPPTAELVIPPLVIPNESVPEPVTANGVSLSPNTAGALPKIQLPEMPAAKNSEQENSALYVYAKAVNQLGQQLNEAGDSFGQAAISYRENKLTLVEFKEKFGAFASQAGNYLNQIDSLSPPAEAKPIHQKLTNGLQKCDDAIDLMDRWFDTQEAGTKNATALLVANCMDQVTKAGDELNALLLQ